MISSELIQSHTICGGVTGFLTDCTTSSPGDNHKNVYTFSCGSRIAQAPASIPVLPRMLTIGRQFEPPGMTLLRLNCLESVHIQSARQQHGCEAKTNVGTLH